MNEIYLASKSPRRLELLQQMGIACKTVLLREDNNRMRDVDETPLASENPFIYVERMAKMKAEIGVLRARQRALPPSMPLLGADTIVVFNGTIFGKPTDAADAKRMLKLLSGTRHEVLTLCRRDGRQKLLHDTCVSRVRFVTSPSRKSTPISPAVSQWAKAGAYAIQGLGGVFVERLEGSYSGVMGLPLFETSMLLSRFGINVL